MGTLYSYTLSILYEYCLVFLPWTVWSHQKTTLANHQRIGEGAFELHFAAIHTPSEREKQRFDKYRIKHEENSNITKQRETRKKDKKRATKQKHNMVDKAAKK